MSTLDELFAAAWGLDEFEVAWESRFPEEERGVALGTAEDEQRSSGYEVARYGPWREPIEPSYPEIGYPEIGYPEIGYPEIGEQGHRTAEEDKP